MGKGDKKTKKGKISMGSYGVRRPKKDKKYVTPETAKEVKGKEVVDGLNSAEEKAKKAKKTISSKDEITEDKTTTKKTSKKTKE